MKKLTTLIAVMLIASGLALAGWALWKTYGTDIASNQQQEELVHNLQSQWKSTEHKEARPSVTSSPEPSVEPTVEPSLPASGEAYGIIKIPRFGDDYVKPMLEGFGAGPDALTKSNALLEEGIVHYKTSAQPGEQGNFAVSGHRNGFGAVFNRIMDLRLGDQVIVETEKGTWAYSVIQEGRQFSPSDTGYIDGDPFSNNDSTSRSLMTLTACEDWDASRRVAVVLERTDI